MHRLFALLIALLWPVCGSAQVDIEDRIRNLLPGTWALTIEIDGVHLEGTTIISADGNVEEYVKVIQNGIVSNLAARGKWTIEGDSMITTYTESSAPGLIAVGSVEREKITFIDSDQLSIVDAEGTALTMSRVRQTGKSRAS